MLGVGVGVVGLVGGFGSFVVLSSCSGFSFALTSFFLRFGAVLNARVGLFGRILLK